MALDSKENGKRSEAIILRNEPNEWWPDLSEHYYLSANHIRVYSPKIDL